LASEVVEKQKTTIYRARRDDYHGFHSKPFDWTAAQKKFNGLVSPFLTTGERDALVDIIATLENLLTAALS
jgi:2-methylcitrate dehydratase